MSNKNPIETVPLDDVALTAPAGNLAHALAEVGLENVQSQVRFQGQLLPAKVQASVSLIDRNARGIHMSRLFRIVSRLHEQELTSLWLNGCIDQMLATHQGLSDAANLAVDFELPVLRPALLSQESGWRNYPVSLRVSATNGERRMHITAKVLYSSTCPCSTGLSRQAMQEKFAIDFTQPTIPADAVMAWLGSKEAVAAVPHSQRSEAICRFEFSPGANMPAPLQLIDEMERALGTPVQAAVKREDEQEFAKRNAANLMFCEDAARKLKAAFLRHTDLVDFQIEVRHFESLHAHDVVARVGKF